MISIASRSLLAAVIAGLALSAWPVASVFGQAADKEEMVVTGSRIRQDPLEEKAPMMTLQRADIDRTGLTSLGELMQRLTTSGSPLTTRQNNSGNAGFPPDGGGIGAGAATADLRNLGSKRTLVLVDGLRWVSESSASGVGSAVDLNSIPLSAIERIEILEDGASAIYGSDAIAGVINVITKKHFDGMELAAYVGTYDEGGETQDYSITFGKDTDDISFLFSVGYIEQKRVRASDIDQARTPIPFVTDGTGGSSGTPQSRIFFNDPNTGFEFDCTTNDGVDGPVYDPANPCAGDDFHPFTTADRFNFAPFNLVLTPSERVNIYTQVQYKLTPNIQLYAKGMYTNRESTNQAAPEPLFIGPDAGNGNLMDTIGVSATNPFNPFGFDLNADPNAGPVNFVFAGRRPLEAGPRIFEQNVNTWYVAGGLQGEFEAANRSFYWDLNALTSQNRADQIKHGAFNSSHIKIALGPVDTCAAISGCVPLNFFGGQGSDGSGTITPEMLSWIGFTQKDVAQQDLFEVSGNISGDIVDLPAGALAFAVGFAHREQDGFFQPDAIVVAGESAGIPAQPTSGSIDVDEFYGEISIPILEGMFLAQYLEVTAAVRYSDYDLFDDTITQFGLNWRPITDLLVRATASEGFRAPTIGELFGSAARFDQTLTDPCSDMLNLGQSQATIDNCIALGVPANGSYVQFNPQISTATGGNDTLTPETADSFTVGIVYAPEWATDASWSNGVELEVTYWDHEVENAIQAFEAQIQLDGCVASGDPNDFLCSGINRTPSGVINGFDQKLTNIGGIETSGWDINLIWTSPEFGIGQFVASWYNTILDEYIEIVPVSTTEFGEIVREGTENGDPERAWPELRSTFILDWVRDEWSAAWTVRYLDEVTEGCSGGAETIVPSPCSDASGGTNKLDSVIYNDLQATWRPGRFNDNLDLTIGINNLFDEDPPACFSCALNGFNGNVYDLPGQFYYARLTYRR